MPTPSLQQTFFQKLRSSRFFSLLKTPEQEELIRMYMNADDAQLMQAMQEIDNSTVELTKIDEERKKKLREQLNLVSEIKVNLGQLKKAQLEEHEETDRKVETKAAEELLQTIDKIPQTNAPKRKKFLGIF